MKSAELVASGSSVVGSPNSVCLLTFTSVPPPPHPYIGKKRGGAGTVVWRRVVGYSGPNKACTSLGKGGQHLEIHLRNRKALG